MCRFLDDCADGDLNVQDFGYESINQITKDLKENVTTKIYATNSLGLLLEDLVSKSGDNREMMEQCLLRFFDAMEVENHRRLNRIVFPASELEKIHSNSFTPVLEIAFFSLKAKISSFIINELVYIQSTVYSIQDLKEDLGKGIYNLPLEIVGAESSYEALISDGKVLEWMSMGLSESKIRSENLLSSKVDGPTKRILETLVKPILNDINEMQLV